MDHDEETCGNCVHFKVTNIRGTCELPDHRGSCGAPIPAWVGHSFRIGLRDREMLSNLRGDTCETYQRRVIDEGTSV